MAYDTANSLTLITQRVGANGGAIWMYKDGDDAATVTGINYVSNAAKLGVVAGDRVIHVDTTNLVTTDLTAVAGATTGTASGALCSAIEPIGETSIALQSAGTGTFLVDDIITFSNDIDNEYRVTTGDADISGGGTLVITPGLVSATVVGTGISVKSDVINVTGGAQELTATGAVNAGITSVELNHASVIVAATIATSLSHPGLFVVKNTSASGTAAHTLTLTAGTFDGTNNVVTLNAPDECLIVFFDSAGNGTIVENVGAAVLS